MSPATADPDSWTVNGSCGLMRFGNPMASLLSLWFARFLHLRFRTRSCPAGNKTCVNPTACAFVQAASNRIALPSRPLRTAAGSPVTAAIAVGPAPGAVTANVTKSRFTCHRLSLSPAPLRQPAQPQPTIPPALRAATVYPQPHEATAPRLPGTAPPVHPPSNVLA